MNATCYERKPSGLGRARGHEATLPKPWRAYEDATTVQRLLLQKELAFCASKWRPGAIARTGMNATCYERKPSGLGRARVGMKPLSRRSSLGVWVAMQNIPL